MNQPTRSWEQLQAGVYHGDVEAYHQLSTALLDYSPPEQVFWHMLMANRYQYGPAYLNSFYAWENAYGTERNRWLDIDPDTRQLMRQLLQKGASRGEILGSTILRELDSLEKLGPVPPDTAH
ncbi:hypothetical protein [Hymenobacter koreensis]|uniref:DUF4375 domain-containing protein n=1 Tax=Hymenobacter koreensis TaxID=1084523 RepID=A0ABP8JBP1_9BACT